jgi:hypothetical protein
MKKNMIGQDAIQSYLKVLATLYMSYECEYTKEQLRRLNMWHMQGKPFADFFNLYETTNEAIRGVVAGTDPNVDDGLDSVMSDLFDALKPLTPRMRELPSISTQHLNLFNKLRLAFFGSESAKRTLMRDVAFLSDPKLNIYFIHEEDDSASSDVYKNLKSLVKKYGNVDGYIIPTEILEDWQAQNKRTGTKVKAHSDYLMLRREVNAIFKKALSNMVRGSGQPYLPIRDVIHNMDNNRVIHNLPEGFVGNIDDLGKFYTTAGKRLLQAPSGDVRMNSRYNPLEDNAYVCEFTPAFAQKSTRAYTEDFRKGSKSKKFDVVAETLPKLDRLSKKWLSDMKYADTKREGLWSTLCEFIYETSARVGNKNAMSSGQQTFGATQLQARHFKMDSSKCVVTYLGKSGGKQKHIIKFNTVRLRKLQDILVKFLEGKGPKDYVFTFRDMAATSTAINKYLVSLGFPKEFTIHKLRTARASLMARDLLADFNFKPNVKDAEVSKWVETEILKVGSELGHMSGESVTASTAIANYVDPSILRTFFDDVSAKLGRPVRPSSKLQKAIDSTD